MIDRRQRVTAPEKAAAETADEAACAVLDDEATPDEGAPTEDDSPETGSEQQSSPEPEDQLDTRRHIPWARVFAFAVIPAVAVLLTLSAGYLKYEDASIRNEQVARSESVRAATDGAIALLSYNPENVDANLTAAGDRLTGDFRDSYTALVKDVVIPGAKQKQISTTASAAAAASISATDRHAVVLVFVNQTIVMAKDAPTSSASAVRVTLDKVDDHWLISGFDPR